MAIGQGGACAPMRSDHPLTARRGSRSCGGGTPRGSDLRLQESVRAVRFRQMGLARQEVGSHVTIEPAFIGAHPRRVERAIPTNAPIGRQPISRRPYRAKPPCHPSIPESLTSARIASHWPTCSPIRNTMSSHSNISFLRGTSERSSCTVRLGVAGCRKLSDAYGQNAA